MEQIFFLFILVGLSILVGMLGKNRKIGFGFSFFLSLFLSPIIGLIITICSKKEDVEFTDMQSTNNE